VVSSGGVEMLVNGGKIPLEIQFSYRQAEELLRIGNYKVALDRLKQVVAVAPHFLKALNAMGICLMNMGRDYEALSKFEKVLKEDPSNQEAAVNRLIILYKRLESK
jgi:Flp pilus assembly protein TadD